jgi:hypothetical protein
VVGLVVSGNLRSRSASIYKFDFWLRQSVRLFFKNYFLNIYFRQNTCVDRNGASRVSLKNLICFVTAAAGRFAIIKQRQKMGISKQSVLNGLRSNLLTLATLGGVLIGVILGVCLRTREDEYTKREAMYVKFIGSLFLQMLKAIIIPLVIPSLIVAVGTLDLSLSGKNTLRVRFCLHTQLLRVRFCLCTQQLLRVR